MDIINALEYCPNGLHGHQALTIIRTLGGDEADPTLQRWLADNCPDQFDDEKDDYDDEDYDDDED